MTPERLKEMNDLFERLWQRIFMPSSISVSGLRMSNDRIAALNRAHIDQSARQFDGIRG